MKRASREKPEKKLVEKQKEIPEIRKKSEPIKQVRSETGHISPFEAHSEYEPKPIPVEKKAVCLLHYTRNKKTPFKSIQETRRYYVGAVNLCYVTMNDEGSNPAGIYVCSISSKAGNGGVGFETEDELHEFLLNEILRNPYNG